jgi:CO/xanthine dehydrogenase FAD-binding subunit
VSDLYLEPRTIDEAVVALAEHGDDAKVVAGGTDLVVLARKRRTPLAPVLVAIHRIDELAGVGEASDGGIRIGASTAHALIERDPWIVERFTALAEHGEAAKVVAGGTDLVVLARKRRTALAPVLVAIHRVAGLAGVGATPDGGVRIGASTAHALIERDPWIVERFTALADGSALVGSPSTRHVGTLGGNLANASPANDTGSPLLVFDASVELTSAAGVRTVPLGAFFEGPGRTALAPGELLTAVVVPPLAWGGGVGSAYVRLDYRQAMEIAVVGAAAMVKLDDEGPIADVRLALTAVAPTCIEVEGVADSLRGGDPDDPATWADAGRRAAETARPIDDVRAPARYRAAMVPVISKRAFAMAVQRARGRQVPVPANLAFAGTLP